MRKRIARFFCKELQDTIYAQGVRISELTAKTDVQKQKLEVFETQKATLLMAAIDASERVAFVVSKRGDETLKAYVDECFSALIAPGAN